MLITRTTCLQPVEEADKARQAVVAGFFIPGGVAEQQPEVRQPQLPARHSLHQIGIAGALVQQADEIVGRHGRRDGAVFLHIAQEGLDARIVRRGGKQREIERVLAVETADPRRVVRREAVDRRQERREQRDVLHGVVYHAEQREHHRDFR